MPAAARVGDFTTHGNTPLTPMIPLVMGSPNVFIGGQPAWRAGQDIHVCPLSNGPAPHVGGSVAKGSLTVFINKLPAARMGDVIQEAGGPNPINKGFDSVQIGG
jgi:uncharacterized Zn-binding protein involved in type VI secretion